MKFGESEVRKSKELEMRGVLQKKNRNGIFQNRYFSTRGAYLEYWSSSQQALTAPMQPSSSYDLREVKIVDSPGESIVYIQFMNEKFKLELRAISDDQCEEWVNFLRAKIALHSPNNLLSDIEVGTDFQTRTFAALLRLKVQDQDRWINDFLNEAFESLYDGTEAVRPLQTVQACRACLDEMALTCEECALEMTSRRPQIIAQCRDYMQRYCDLFRSRLTLELSGFMGISARQSDLIELGEECLIEGIRFFNTLDGLKNHKFLARSLFMVMRENLVGADQLTRAFLKVLSDRNDSWYSELYELQPRQRGNKLAEYYKIIDFQIQRIHDCFHISDLYDAKSKEILLLSAVDTLAMSIARHVSRTSFADYGEEALLSHILACQECVRYFSSLRIYPCAGRVAKQGVDTALDDESTKSKWVMALSRVCIEQVGGIFLRSAHEAATAAVLTVSHTSLDIVHMLFVETGGWIGGKVVRAYLDRVTSWMEAFCQRGASKPCEFHRIIRRETIRMVVVTYLQQLIDKYRLNKRFKLSANGETQVASDLQIIGRWVEQNNEKLIPSYVSDRGSYTGSNDVTMLIRNARLFMTSDEASILLCFVESIQHFGITCAPHLYDLARLALKIRSDLPKKVRLNVLGSFACYISKVTAATIEGFGPLSHPHPRISGPSILQELFPHVGVMHCTGKKWSYEKLADPDGTLNLEISTLVTDACNVARIRRSAYRDNSTIIQHHDGPVRNGGDASSLPLQPSPETPESVDTWQLLDPDHLRMEHGPLDTERPSLEAMTEERDRLLAAAAISLLDAAEFSAHNPSEKYSADAYKPFVDLYGCSFEELHNSLRPPMYGEDTFATPQLAGPCRLAHEGSCKVFGRHPHSDEDSVSEDEFTDFDGVFFDSERCLSMKVGAASIIFPVQEEPPPADVGNPSDIEVVIEPGDMESSALDVQTVPGEGKRESTGGGSGNGGLEDVIPAGLPVSAAMLPPAKPPKPRRYSNSEQLDQEIPAERKGAANAEAQHHDDIAEQLRLAQEHLPERCRIPSVHSDTSAS